jgi:hypothetical protein
VQVGDYYGPEPRRLLPGTMRSAEPAPRPDDTKLN